MQTKYEQLKTLGALSKLQLERLVQSKTYTRYTLNMSEHDLYIAARTILTLEINRELGLEVAA